MNLKQLQQSIKLSIKVINKALTQMPVDRKPFIMSRVNDVLTRNLQQQQTVDLEKLKKFHQELQFNLNFIKLSHPNLDFTLDPVQDENENKQQAPPSVNEYFGLDKKSSKPVKHQFDVVNEQKVQYERLNIKDTFDQQAEIQQKARTQVQFSNWFDGNVDPQQLKRHKQLLERQHFKGQFWKQKQVPQSMSKAYLQSVMQQQLNSKDWQAPKKDRQLPDYMPHQYDQKQSSWQKVKR